MKLHFGPYFAVDVGLGCIKLNLGRGSEARFGQDFEVEVQARFAAFFLLMFCRGYEVEYWSIF